MEGFLLGISSGTVCLAHCAPVMVPYFLGEGNPLSRNAADLTGFLTGRLTGYLLFGFLAWLMGRILSTTVGSRDLFFGIIYIFLAAFMVYYGLFVSKERCLANSVNGIVNRFFARRKWIMVVSLGFLTGINFCPPFLLAFASSAHTDSLSNSLIFFFTFFLGTSLYFLPVVFLGALNRYRNLKTIGKMTAVVMAVYFFYKGLVLIIGRLVLS